LAFSRAEQPLGRGSVRQNAFPVLKPVSAAAGHAANAPRAPVAPDWTFVGVARL